MADQTLTIQLRGDSAGAVRAVRETVGELSKLLGVSVQVGDTMDKATRRTEGALDRLTDAAGKTETAVRQIGSGVAAGAAPYALATQRAMEYEHALRSVDSIAKLSPQNFDKLYASVLSLARDDRITKSPVDLARGLYQVYSSGKQGQEALDILRQSALGATAGMTDTSVAAQVLLGVLNSGITGVHDARAAMDVLFQTVNLGQVEFPELAASIGQVLPTAAQAGISLQEVSAAVALMTLKSQDASGATNDLLNLISKIIRPGEGGEQIFRKLGISYGINALQAKGLSGVLDELTTKLRGNDQALMELFPDLQASRGLLSLLTGEGRAYRSMLDQMAEATAGVGATQQAVDRILPSTKSQWEKLRKELEITGIETGTKLLPELNKLLKFLGDHPEAAKMAVEIGAITVAVNQLTQALKGLGAVEAFKWLAGRFAATTVGGAVAGAGLLGAGALAVGGGVIATGIGAANSPVRQRALARDQAADVSGLRRTLREGFFGDTGLPDPRKALEVQAGVGRIMLGEKPGSKIDAALSRMLAEPAPGAGNQFSNLTLKAGITLEGLEAQARKLLPMLDAALQKLGTQGTITSTFRKGDGSSAHHGGRAIDLVTDGDMEQIAALLRTIGLKAAFEKKGQVNANGSVATGDHIHITLVPKGGGPIQPPDPKDAERDARGKLLQEQARISAIASEEQRELENRRHQTRQAAEKARQDLTGPALQETLAHLQAAEARDLGEIQKRFADRRREEAQRQMEEERALQRRIREATLGRTTPEERRDFDLWLAERDRNDMSRAARGTLTGTALAQELEAIRAAFAAQEQRIQAEFRKADSDRQTERSRNLLDTSVTALEDAQRLQRQQMLLAGRSPEDIAEAMATGRWQGLANLQQSLGSQLQPVDLKRLDQLVFEAQEASFTAFADRILRAEAEQRAIRDDASRRADERDAAAQRLRELEQEREGLRFENTLQGAAQRGDRGEQLRLIQAEVEALRYQQFFLDESAQSTLAREQLQQRINQLLTQESALTQEIAAELRGLLDLGTQGVEFALQRHRELSALRRELPARELALQVQHAERFGRPAEVQSALRAQIDQARLLLQELEQKLTRLTPGTARALRLQHQILDLREFEDGLLGRLEQFRPRWQLFWRSMGDDMALTLRGSFVSLFEDLFAGQTENLLDRLTTELRAMVGRAVGNLALQGLESGIRDALGGMFGGGGRGRDERPLPGGVDSDNPPPPAEGGEPDGMSAGNRLMGVIGLTVGGLATLAAAIQKTSDGLDKAAPMLFAALAQLVVGILIARGQISAQAAGPAGLIIGAVAGIASLFSHDSPMQDSQARRWGFDFGTAFGQGTGDALQREAGIGMGRPTRRGPGGGMVVNAHFYGDINSDVDLERGWENLGWITQQRLRYGESS